MEILTLHDEEHEIGLRFEIVNLKLLMDKVFADPENYIFLSDVQEYAQALSYVTAFLAGSLPPEVMEDPKETTKETCFLFAMIVAPKLFPAAMKDYVVGLLAVGKPGIPNAVFFVKRGETEKRKIIVLSALIEHIRHYKSVDKDNRN
jgi:hypothetical protein